MFAPKFRKSWRSLNPFVSPWLERNEFGHSAESSVAAAMHSYPLLSGAGIQRTATHYAGFAVGVETAGVETQTGVTCRAARRLGFTDCQMPEFGKRKGTVRSEKKEKSLKVALRSTFSRVKTRSIYIYIYVYIFYYMNSLLKYVCMYIICGGLFIGSTEGEALQHQVKVSSGQAS